LIVAIVATSKQAIHRTPAMKTSLGVQTVIIVLLVLASTTALVTPELLGGAAPNAVRTIMARLVLGRH
jgi:hypothetical protein